MESKAKNTKPPLANVNRSLQNILNYHSPTNSVQLPPLAFKVKKTSSTPRSRISISTNSPRNLLKIETLYEKIQSFESPQATSKAHRVSNSISPQQCNLLKSPFKTPSPKHKNEEIFSEWEIKQALDAPKTKNLREKRSVLIGSLKSY